MKYKGIGVYRKPWYTNIGPWRYSRGHTIFGKIYIRGDLFENFVMGKANSETISVLEHEREHIKRSSKLAFLMFEFRYFTSSMFRYSEELAAIKHEMKVLKRKGGSFDIDKRARALSGLFYFWATSYKNAARDLQKMWGELS